MKANQITQWLLGALLVVVITTTGLLYTANEARLNRMEVANEVRSKEVKEKIDKMEQKIDQIQAQYGQITEVKATVTAQGQQLDRIEKWIYERIK